MIFATKISIKTGNSYVQKQYLLLCNVYNIQSLLVENNMWAIKLLENIVVTVYPLIRFVLLGFHQIESLRKQRKYLYN